MRLAAFLTGMLIGVVFLPSGTMAESDERVEELRRRKAHAEGGGGQARVSAQTAKGKMTARERID